LLAWRSLFSCPTHLLLVLLSSPCPTHLLLVFLSYLCSPVLRICSLFSYPISVLLSYAFAPCSPALSLFSCPTHLLFVLLSYLCSPVLRICSLFSCPLLVLRICSLFPCPTHLPPPKSLLLLLLANITGTGALLALLTAAAAGYLARACKCGWCSLGAGSLGACPCLLHQLPHLLIC